MAENRIHRVTEMDNLDFLRRYGKPGCIGLMGGSSAIDRAIRTGQRGLDDEAKPSLWSHALLFEGERIDGRYWVIESDIELGGGQLRNGVAENRIEKYGADKEWPNIAVLDFGLKDKDVRRLLIAALDLVAKRTRYDLSGVVETYWAMMRKTLHKGKEKDSTFCSAFVRTVYRHVGLDLAPEIAVQHTLPEHVSRTALPHDRYLLIRDGT